MTDARIEAAAKAAYEWDADHLCADKWEDFDKGAQDWYREIVKVALVAAEAQNHETRKALETLTRCIHEAHADGETFPIRLSVACHAADELLART